MGSVNSIKEEKTYLKTCENGLETTINDVISNFNYTHISNFLDFSSKKSFPSAVSTFIFNRVKETARHYLSYHYKRLDINTSSGFTQSISPNGTQDRCRDFDMSSPKKIIWESIEFSDLIDSITEPNLDISQRTRSDIEHYLQKMFREGFETRSIFPFYDGTVKDRTVKASIQFGVESSTLSICIWHDINIDLTNPSDLHYIQNYIDEWIEPIQSLIDHVFANMIDNSSKYLDDLLEYGIPSYFLKSVEKGNRTILKILDYSNTQVGIFPELEINGLPKYIPHLMDCVEIIYQGKGLSFFGYVNRLTRELLEEQGFKFTTISECQLTYTKLNYGSFCIKVNLSPRNHVPHVTIDVFDHRPHKLSIKSSLI